MKGRSLISVQDFTKEEIMKIFKTTEELKIKQKKGEKNELLKGKSLAMIFQKPSTRTRVSFEVGMTQLGGHALYLGPNDLQLNRGETIADTARVLSRYCDVIMARVFAHQDVVDLAKYATVPVINGLSDLLHPCQALTDLFTVLEKKGSLKGINFAFVGDGDNNITHSLMITCSKLGVNITVGCPKHYTVNKDIYEMCKNNAKLSKSEVKVVEDPKLAVKGADVVYTDIWVSMGREDREKRLKIFPPYQLNSKLLKLAKPDAIVMHDMPAHRGEEITDEVMDGKQSVIIDQAENRMHVQKGIMALIVK